ncbi:hypothetical protein JCM8097_008489 [Rhodosporidiobolus ruineniae]
MSPRPVPEHFDEIANKHCRYTYGNGWAGRETERTYEFWVKNHERIVYQIHSGPLAGRVNFQTAYYQRLRPHQWQISWVEETASQVTLCVDFDEKTVTSFIALSWGHFHHAHEATGWKREKMDEWRKLGKIKPEPENRVLLPEKATIHEISEGRGDLPDIEMEWPTL